MSKYPAITRPGYRARRPPAPGLAGYILISSGSLDCYSWCAYVALPVFNQLNNVGHLPTKIIMVSSVRRGTLTARLSHFSTVLTTMTYSKKELLLAYKVTLTLIEATPGNARSPRVCKRTMNP
ncbi:hypothetical protein EVAR_4098_1 [Eumeta japonica]|uniref:Uncharacterized protein n=1 Tax=Eumeta variegata TaxID=151549 RepID=A0A4C1T4Z0_EUMVA|nr:hypothetical protein EVAR_4098_1 [Eumeta japonica]